MNEIKYNINFDKLCKELHLGDIIVEPTSLTGGFLHRMFAVETTKGKYAIKALNPNIMLRPTAMKNYMDSERIANFSSSYIEALPAKNINNSFMHQVDNQYYLIFDWIDGTCLKPDELSKEHCEKIGLILAKIHNIDFSSLNIQKKFDSNDLNNFQWTYYLQKGIEFHAEWIDLLQTNIDKLATWSLESKKAQESLSKDIKISHRDLDPKNVLWVQDSPIIIDWESAGFIHPLQELIETAIYWAESQTSNFDKERFISFLDGYKKGSKKIEANWHLVLFGGFLGKLEWLEYSLKRSLGLECTDTKEQQLGTEQVTYTIQSLIQYENLMIEIEELLKEYYEHNF